MKRVSDWSKIKHFDSWEFASPDEPESGKYMSEEFVLKLDRAREIAGVSFNITSGIRTYSHNALVGGVSNSSHLPTIGCAADIKITSNANRRKIMNALIKVGLDRRMGIGEGFIHVDDDPTKPSSYWHYYRKKSNLAKVMSFFGIGKNTEQEDV